jgi:V8-like Glu-specific endopeptidase
MPTAPEESNYAKLAARLAGASWIARSPGLGLALVVVRFGLVATSSCVAVADDAPPRVDVSAGSVGTRIVEGQEDDDDRSVAGVVALRVGAAGQYKLCTGTLVAPTLVLTARHCVAMTLSNEVSCYADGRSASGEQVAGNEALEDIVVFLGGSPAFATAPAARARAIIAPSGPSLCDSDIAVIVLDKPIVGVTPLPLRLHSPAHPGERIRSVGYGRDGRSEHMGMRFRKDAVTVLAQGMVISPSRTPLGAHEFEVGRSICSGDSGGPAISEDSGAVIGVASRGADCEEDSGHVYTTTAGFDSMFEEAFATAGTTANVERGDASSSAAPARSIPEVVSARPSDQGGASAASCSTRRAGRAPAGYLAIAVAAAVALFARRRRCSARARAWLLFSRRATRRLRCRRRARQCVSMSLCPSRRARVNKTACRLKARGLKARGLKARGLKATSIKATSTKATSTKARWLKAASTKPCFLAVASSCTR